MQNTPQDSIFIRDYEKNDQPLVQDFAEFIKQKYPNAATDLLTNLVDNYFDAVLGQGGKLFIFEDAEDFAGLLIFRENGNRRATIDGVYFIEEYEVDGLFARHCFEHILDDLREREFKEIQLFDAAFVQPIVPTLQWLRFKHNPDESAWMKRF